MTTPLFFCQRNTKGSVSPIRPSATPTSCTWIGHAYVDRARFFQVHTLVEHISPRSSTCLRKTELERKRTRFILQSSFFFERKKERARERELQWWQRVVVHASVGHASSRSATCLFSPQPSLSQTKLSKPPQPASKLAIHTVLAVRTQAAKVTFFLQRTCSCRLLGALHVVTCTGRRPCTAWQAGTQQQCPLTQQRPTGSWKAQRLSLLDLRLSAHGCHCRVAVDRTSASLRRSDWHSCGLGCVCRW